MRALTNLPFYILVCFSALLTACKEQAQNDIKHLDQIRPQSTSKQRSIDTSDEKDTLSIMLKTYANDSSRLHMAKIILDTTQRKHFLNRFSKQHFHLICTDSLLQNYQHQEWSFTDSSQAQEAFFNWLDQMESNKPFKIGASDRVFKNSTLIVLVSNKIIQVSSLKHIKHMDWLRLFCENLNNAPFNYVILGKPNRNTKWYQYKHGQLLTL